MEAGPRTRPRVLLLGTLVVAAVSCGAGEGSPGVAPTASPDAAVDPSSVPPRVGAEPGRAAPDFALPAAGGGTFRLSARRGRVVVLDFLAPGCADCSIEVATLEAVARRFGGDGVEVVVVDVSGLPVEAVAPYYRDLGGTDLTYLGDRGFEAVRAYDVVSLGTTVIVDPRGAVAFRDGGFTPSNVLRREVLAALG